MTDLHRSALHPLDIPEIRDYLSQFLTIQCLAACARVSRDWYKSFQYRVWASVTIVRSTQRPSVSDAQKNAPFIRKLDLRTHESSWFTDLTCPNLVDLTLARPIKKDRPEISFLQRHGPTLRTLNIGNISEQNGYQVWTALAESCTRLQCLSVHVASIGRTQWPAIWKVWSKLDELNVAEGVYFQRKNPSDTAMPWSDLGSQYSTITTLSLTVRRSMTTEDQIELVTHCPALRKLNWRLSSNAVRYAPMRHLVRLQNKEKSCSKLLALRMDGNLYPEQDLVAFITLTRQDGLLELSLESGSFGKTSWLALQSNVPNCLNTLQVLRLRGCMGVDGPMALEILCSLPMLKEFTAPLISSFDLDKDPRPWICNRSMLHLHLGIGLESRDKQGLVFARLAALKHLQVLKLGVQSSNQKGVDLLDVDLGLEHGLDLLDPLKELLEFGVEVHQSLSSTDVEWMIQHWPSLRIVRGQLNTETETRSSLSLSLDNAHIEHWLV